MAAINYRLFDAAKSGVVTDKPATLAALRQMPAIPYGLMQQVRDA